MKQTGVNKEAVCVSRASEADIIWSYFGTSSVKYIPFDMSLSNKTCFVPPSMLSYRIVFTHLLCKFAPIGQDVKK